MTLSLRDTLTRSVRPVEPLEPGRVRMYTCGPTVYRFAHVGNLRSNLLADLIRRVLLYHGIEVFHVKNITDVGHLRDERFDRGEDRMLVQAGLEHKTPAEIAAAYEAAFHADEALVDILPANVFPRATEHIAEMVELAERLEDAGHAYASPEGNLYYSVASFPDYGRLSGNTLDELRAGHRGEIEPDKRDSADFALWKAAGEGRLLKWPTPRWGEGYPGWHLECSAMAMRYLGDRFDIHTGGIDNVFPHHEDEIAQSAPFVGGVPANHWVHGEFLLMSGKKMAKSAGNFQRVTELIDRGIDPLAFRYLVLTSRYAHKLDYSDESIDGAAAALTSLRARLRALGAPPDGGPWRAPVPLRAGTAGDRPTGIVPGPLGHGAGERPVHRVRPGAGAGRPAVRDRPGAPPAVRRRHRRRPRPAGGARRRARGPARGSPRRRATLARAGCGPGARARPRPRLGGRWCRRRCGAGCRAGAGRRACHGTRGPGLRPSRRAPCRDRGRGMGGRGLGGWVDRPAARLVAEAYVELTRRSRREPNRSMIR